MDLIERLKSQAEQAAKATQMIADAKSQRNQAAGDVDACYMGVTKERTLEWQAADEIERLRIELEMFMNVYTDISRIVGRQGDEGTSLAMDVQNAINRKQD